MWVALVAHCGAGQRVSRLGCPSQWVYHHHCLPQLVQMPITLPCSRCIFFKTWTSNTGHLVWWTHNAQMKERLYFNKWINFIRSAENSWFGFVTGQRWWTQAALSYVPTRGSGLATSSKFRGLKKEKGIYSPKMGGNYLSHINPYHFTSPDHRLSDYVTNSCWMLAILI